MKDKRFAAEPKLDLGDLDINLGDAPAEEPEAAAEPAEKSEPEIKDIPVGDETSEDSEATPDATVEDDLFGPDAGSEPAAAQTSPVPDSSGEINKLKGVLKKHLASLQVQIAELQAENSSVTLEVTKLKNDLNAVYEKHGELKKVFEEYLLFKIPTYEEIDINLSKKDPAYITRAISDALDRKLIKIFHDLPIYNINKFDILRTDDNNNIVNGNISVTVTFKDLSKFRFLEFDLELWVLDSYLNIPQWFMYQNDIYPLNEDGMRRVDVINNRMDQSQETGRKTTWVNMQEHNKNKMVVKQNVDVPINYQSGNSPVYVPNRKI